MNLTAPCALFQGSITYPYRSLLKDISFPRYHFMSKPGNEAEAFTGSLGMLGHGVPLWNPIGDLDRPKEQLDSSISIGDVGFLSLTGEFKCYFNIFLPPESKYQTLCPQDLIPLAKPLESELCREDMHFAAGTALVSNGIEASILSSSPLYVYYPMLCVCTLTTLLRDIQFTVHTREGGILVLPDGASREDLISTDCIRDYVQKNILGWYMFFNEKMGGPIYSNGTLYVVTGTDKAVRWASCLTYPRETKRRRIMNPSTIIYRGARGEKIHYWEENTHTEEELMWKRYRGVDIDEVKICTLFLRGMRFAVNERDWSRCILYYETPDRIPYSIVRTMPALGLRAKVQTFKERRPSYSQKVPYGIRVRFFVFYVFFDRAWAYCYFQAFFHPLDVILHLLLKEVGLSLMLRLYKYS